MATVTVDTWKFARSLEAVGVPREQATAIAEALSEALETRSVMKSDTSDIKERARNNFDNWLVLLPVFCVVATVA